MRVFVDVLIATTLSVYFVSLLLPYWIILHVWNDVYLMNLRRAFGSLVNGAKLTACHEISFETRLSHSIRISSTTMSMSTKKQPSIATFFQPSALKKSLHDKSPGPVQNPKRQKLDNQETSCPSQKTTPLAEKNTNSETESDFFPSTPQQSRQAPQLESPEKHNGIEAPPQLSPEQKALVDDKRLIAKAKLLSKSTEGLVVNFGSSWLKALEAQFTKPYFQKLCRFVSEERSRHTVFPPAEQVFSWTNMCPIQKVKVVILGQDPYHGTGQAHGLCFSVQGGVTPPPSLVNMYKELESDIEGFKRPNHGDLSGWAQQGVLLLNAVLTVRAHNANSHKDRGWEQFTDAVITWINEHNSGVVFMLWGAYAQKKGARVNKKKHHILTTVHPSPLSAHRGFFGCRHFSQCNSLLKKQGQAPIDWSHLPKM